MHAHSSENIFLKRAGRERGEGVGASAGMNGPQSREARVPAACQATSERPRGTFRRSALGKYLSTSPPQHFDQYPAHWLIFSIGMRGPNLSPLPVTFLERERGSR